jgi:hypothetical protein
MSRVGTRPAFISADCERRVSRSCQREGRRKQHRDANAVRESLAHGLESRDSYA